MNIKTFLAAGSFIILAACGGGGGGSSSDAPAPTRATQPATPAAPIKQSATIKIAMYGDSTTYGSTFANGGYVQSSHNEPATLQLDLQKVYGSAVTVDNRGVPGSTCAQWLWGQKDVKQAWTVEMANSDAQIVTMNCAINDAFMPTETDEDFKYMYGQFAQIAKQYGKTFVIMTPNPIDDGHNANLWSLVHDEQYVSGMEQVSIVDDWTMIQAQFPTWANDLPDHIHPNDALYEYKASLAFSTLSNIVSQLIKL